MEKQDLKSLLENIYHLLAEEGEWHPPMLIPPEDPNWSIYPPPPPWLSPLSPTGPITPTSDPETPTLDPDFTRMLQDLIRQSTPSGWLRIRGFPPEGVPPLPGGFPLHGTQEWYYGLTPEQRQLLVDWVNQHFGMLDLFNHREFFEDVLQGHHTEAEVLKWLKENWPELYRP